MTQTLDILKALSDSNRLRIVLALTRHRELCACQITELLRVTGATVSRHLGILQHAGLLESRREGRWIHYRLIVPSDEEPLFTWLKSSCGATAPFTSDVRELDRILGIEREDLCRMQRGEACCP